MDLSLMKYLTQFVIFKRLSAHFCHFRVFLTSWNAISIWRANPQASLACALIAARFKMQDMGSLRLESPESFRGHFGWHNSLCIFKRKASRGTKLFAVILKCLVPLQRMKRPALQKKRVEVLRRFLGLSRKTSPRDLNACRSISSDEQKWLTTNPRPKRPMDVLCRSTWRISCNLQI